MIDKLQADIRTGHTKAAAIIVIGDNGCETVLIHPNDKQDALRLMGGMRALTSQLNMRLSLPEEITQSIGRQVSGVSG